jgi:hypothetical protein
VTCATGNPAACGSGQGQGHRLHHTDDVLKGTTNLQIVALARRVNPGAVIIANAIELKDSRGLYEAGADYVFLPRIETAKAVEQAIEKALAGEIRAYREQVEAGEGEWHARQEVL